MRWNREDGGSRYIKDIHDNCWVSVLHRMTVFGYMEWESALCVIDPETRKHTQGSPLIIRGDWREAIESMSKEEVFAFFKAHEGELNSFETVLKAIREA